MKKIQFQNNNGDSLSAVLDLPLLGHPKAYALFAHCFTCSKNYITMRNVSQTLIKHGIAVFRFDFTGLGDSEGDFSETNFSSNIQDIMAAVSYLRENYEEPELMIGHSLGGTAVLSAADQVQACKAVVTIGSPGESKYVFNALKNKLDEIQSAGQAEVSIAGRPFIIKKQFLDDVAAVNMREKIRSLGRALLVLHSPVDDVVHIDNAKEIFTAAQHPKSFVSLDNTDHLLSKMADAVYVGNLIASWAERYVISAEKPGAAKLIPVKNQSVVRTGKPGFFTEIVANGHPLIADEPVEYGGTDLGPTPYDLLATSLGACTSMTIRMYSERKKWPLESVIVKVKHEKIHSQDCGDCETENKMVDVLERELEFIGQLNEEQKERLRQIADKCPVHKTLSAEIKIRTKIKNSSDYNAHL